MTTIPSASPAADGMLVVGPDGCVIRFVRHLAHPVERVWAAITDPEQVRAWLGELTVDLVEGGDLVLRWLNTDESGNHAVLTGTITRLDPPFLLEYAGDIHGTLRWELAPDGAGTRLMFSATGELPEEYRSRNLAGWHWHLDALARALDGVREDWAHWDYAGWQRIHAGYAE